MKAAALRAARYDGAWAIEVTDIAGDWPTDERDREYLGQCDRPERAVVQPLADRRDARGVLVFVKHIDAMRARRAAVDFDEDEAGS